MPDEAVYASKPEQRFSVGSSRVVNLTPRGVVQVEFEIEFEHDGAPDLDKFHVHIRCFAAWELIL